MDIKNTIASKAIDAGGRLRVKSALNPMLWLCAIVTLPGLVYIGQSDREVSFFIQLTVTSPVFIALFGFLYLLFFDRDKLQSEDYQIRKQTLELVQEKGDEFPMIARTLEAISNPASNYLEHKSNEGEKL
ncbi:hypothetical protein [Aeromonas veronii]|uniref:hypothetical protein n=1 Tax=Aeromonas veronii TaxID=654 RepID=UPI0040556F02